MSAYKYFAGRKLEWPQPIVDSWSTPCTLPCGHKMPMRPDGSTADCVFCASEKAIDEMFDELPKTDRALDRQEGGGHYKDFAIQPVEFITANKLSFLEGCVIKRVRRHRAKNGAEDIRKAIHELELLLELEYPQKGA